MDFNFEWDTNKARTNREKHGITFEEGATVFMDPRALTVYDLDHSGVEERWITLGITSLGRLLLVCHTFFENENGSVTIRIFSSRKATNNEIRSYEV